MSCRSSFPKITSRNFEGEILIRRTNVTSENINGTREGAAIGFSYPVRRDRDLRAALQGKTASGRGCELTLDFRSRQRQHKTGLSIAAGHPSHWEI